MGLIHRAVCLCGKVRITCHRPPLTGVGLCPLA